ncbi:MAG: DNA glycosylase AlkZ-like family protein [Candidatus Xenobia bacterium]
MIELSAAQARRHLVGQLGLSSFQGQGAEAVRRLLQHLRCIQLDPLDVVGSNADLVVMARVEGVPRGGVFDAVYPGHAFEHFAKERCLLPAHAFAYYRKQAAETPWWRLGERLQRLPHGILEDVLAEVRARGPVTPEQLTDRGRVEPLDWDGWKGTGKAVSMALEVLWTRCEVVVCGRTPRGKLYDVPERALAAHVGQQLPNVGHGGSVGQQLPNVGHGGSVGQQLPSVGGVGQQLPNVGGVGQQLPSVGGVGQQLPSVGSVGQQLPNAAAESGGDFGRWALLERVEAAGLLSRSGGPLWSMLSAMRTSSLPDDLVAEGLLEEVTVEGSKRPYLAPRGFLSRRFPQPDGRIRILGPLDPLLWDRKLVQHAFGFDYVWEVYKPAEQRRWDWYVCPLLQDDRLVGRLSGAVQDGVLRVTRVWREPGIELDRALLREALERHARLCGARGVRLPRRFE